MPVRKPASSGQFDLFAAAAPGAVKSAPVRPPPKPANDEPPVAPRAKPPAAPAPPAADEWWTTRMACSFLKISRKTLWERRRDPALKFPQPVHLGGARNLYRASAIRAWAERMAGSSMNPDA